MVEEPRPSKDNMEASSAITNYLGGEFVSPRHRGFLSNINPATGEEITTLPASTSDDIDDAVEAAHQAFPQWSSLGKEERAAYLTRIANLLERDQERFALAETIDTGKPLTLSRSVDIPRAISNLRFFASAITQWGSELYEGPGALHATVRPPLGVVSCISPWNLPLYLFTWKIAPALATGNCVVAKPSELTPTTAFLFSKLCQEAGLPPGVLNVVHGTGISTGAPLCKHPKVRAVSFTGGTATGTSIATAVADSLKKVSLELGGKNPAVIFADCDAEQAVATTLRSSFSNQGQICLCTSRLYVERPLFGRFVELLSQRASSLVIGDPLEASTHQGALISEAHLSKVESYISLGKEEGGEVITGGQRVQVSGRCERGSFLRPTIIVGLPPESRVNQEEIFGPVVTITPFDTEEEACSLANSTRYGLAATVWTNSYERAHRCARAIDSGLIWINSWMVRDLRVPFGGMKDSGLGREGGIDALRFFTETKSICFSANESF